MAANFFTGVTNSNWSVSTNWSLAAVPTASDGNPATFNAASPNCTVDGSARVCNGLDFRGAGVTDYAGTITMTNQITVSGSLTFAAGMGISGSGAMLCNAAGTITWNGRTWPNAMTLSGAVTFTIADNGIVTGLLSLGSGVSTTTLNGAQITANGGVTFVGTTAIVTGSTVLVVGGGTITGATTSGQCRLPLTITAASSTVTFAAAVFNYNTGTLTATLSGSVVTTGSTLNVATASTTLACSAITWNLVTLSGSITVTLSENLNAGALVTLGATTLSTVLNGSTLNCAAGLTQSNSTGNISGTTVIALTGTGTVQSSGYTTSRGILNPVHINAPGGTITVTTPVLIDFGKLTWQAGAVITDNTWTTAGGARSFGF